MRDRERWWWVLVFVGIACLFAAVVVPYHLVATAPTPAENQFVTDDDYRQWIGAYVFLGVALLGFGVTLIIIARRAHRRHKLRLATFVGDTDVMPLAEIRTDAAATPAVTAQPLELMWRSSKMTGFFYTLIFIVQGLGLLLTVGLVLFGLVVALVQPMHPLSIWNISLLIAGIVALVAVLAGLVIAGVRVFPLPVWPPVWCHGDRSRYRRSYRVRLPRPYGLG